VPCYAAAAFYALRLLYAQTLPRSNNAWRATMIIVPAACAVRDIMVTFAASSRS